MKQFYCLLKILAVYLVLSCSPLSQAQEDKIMERFDIETFNRNKSGYSWIHTLQDGSKVWEREIHGKGYQTETTVPNSAYTDIKVFNYDGNLIATFLNFYNINIGVSKEYDGKGNVTKQYNQEEKFSFSIDDLVKKMHDEFNVDIADTQKTKTIRRGLAIINGKEIPLYSVYNFFPEPGEKYIHKLMGYVIDGTTGEVLYSRHTNLDADPDVLGVYTELVESGRL